MTKLPDAPAPAAPRPGPWPEVVPLGRALLVLLMAVATMGLCLLTTPPTGTTVAGVTLTLPYRIGDWWGTAQGMSPAEKALLPPDTGFARVTYESAAGENITCSIVLAGAEKRSIHRPEICLPGQGWTIQTSDVVDIPLHSGRVLQATNLSLRRPVRLQNGQEKEITSYYLYWFVGEGVTTPDYKMRILLTSWDRIVHHVNHRWAYIIVNALIPSSVDPHGKNGVETLAMLKSFTADIVPYFQIAEAPEGPVTIGAQP